MAYSLLAYYHKSLLRWYKFVFSTVWKLVSYISVKIKIYVKITFIYTILCIFHTTNKNMTLLDFIYTGYHFHGERD